MMLILSFVFGWAMFLIYDFFGCMSIWKKKKQISSRKAGIKRFFGDLIFCFVSACLVVMLLYYYNKGSFRIGACAAFGAGCVLYRVTVRSIFLGLFSFLWDVLYRILFFILRPFYVFFTFLRKKHEKCYLKIIILLEKKQKRCYNIYEVNYLKKSSQKGFLKN